MKTYSRRYLNVRSVVKWTMVLGCTSGFLWQTAQFLKLYWDYATVLDIQVGIPNQIDLPAISFCDHNGYNPDAICEWAMCAENWYLHYINICKQTPIKQFCIDGVVKPNIRLIFYKTVAKSEHSFSEMKKMMRSITDTVECEIVSERGKKKCNLEDYVIGSYYSKNEMFHVCYTINSLWSQPNKVINKIHRNEKIVMRFNNPLIMDDNVKYDSPAGSAAIQFQVHSPYTMISPFVDGIALEGGKDYKIKVNMEEKHLLPAPYQTNCTDYLSAWKARGGVGPMNIQMVLEECKKNKSLEMNSCIFFDIDYPHNETICYHPDYEDKENQEKKIYNYSHNLQCSSLVDEYSQPCFSQIYTLDVKEKFTTFTRNIKFTTLSTGYQCSNLDMMFKYNECGQTNLTIDFENFQTTNITYKPKMESLELWSALGGYIQLYVGISLLNIHDIILLIKKAVRKLRGKKRKKKRRRAWQKARRPPRFYAWN